MSSLVVDLGNNLGTWEIVDTKFVTVYGRVDPPEERGIQFFCLVITTVGIIALAVFTLAAITGITCSILVFKHIITIPIVGEIPVFILSSIVLITCSLIWKIIADSITPVTKIKADDIKPDTNNVNLLAKINQAKVFARLSYPQNSSIIR